MEGQYPYKLAKKSVVQTYSAIISLFRRTNNWSTTHLLHFWWSLTYFSPFWLYLSEIHLTLSNDFGEESELISISIDIPLATYNSDLEAPSHITNHINHYIFIQEFLQITYIKAMNCKYATIFLHIKLLEGRQRAT